MLMSERIRLSEASAGATLIKTPLSVRLGRSSHPVRNPEQSFFGELSRFLLPEFEDGINFTVHPLALCVQADLVEKSVGTVSADENP